MSRIRHSLAAIGLALMPFAAAQSPTSPKPQDEVDAPRRTTFAPPCDDYAKGLRGKGNFGALVDPSQGPPFGGTYHLAEDVWLPAKTAVRAVADGLVRYSAFSPTWTDPRGTVHWNLGNVIVIEHELAPPEGDLTHVCSFYVHLGTDRSVRVGDRVKRGQRIGSIGKDRSEENGRYPVHLHFGIHRGPYFQVTDTLRREIERDTQTTGLPISGKPGEPPRFVRAKVETVELLDEATIAIHLEGGEQSIQSLEIGSTVPKDGEYAPPPDIMHWCVGYGEKLTVAEWVRPSEWIAQRLD